jgi:type VI secretion system protein ImpA
MATPEVLDFEVLLAPISDEAPTGSPLRRPDGTIDPDYDRIKTAAQDARTRERQLANWQPAADESQGGSSDRPAPPDWRTVEREAIRVLAGKSKDLWIAAWLVEALVRNKGFPGVRDGLRLVRELVERYWDQLYPVPAEDDDESPTELKVTQIAGLNGLDSEGVLIPALRNIPLVDSDEWGPLSLSHYVVASSLASMADGDARQKRAASTGAVTIDQFETVVVGSSPTELRVRLEDIDQSLEECKRLADALDAACVGEDGESEAPPLGNIRSVLTECRDCLNGLLSGSSPAGEAGVGGNDAGHDSAMSHVLTGVPSAAAGRVQTRDDAFRALLQVADFFRRTEPHSPVSYALEQAVRWGRMSLPDLLRELVEDSSTRSEIFRRTGIQEPGEDS